MHIDGHLASSSVVGADGMKGGLDTCEGDRRGAGCVDHHGMKKS